MNRYEIITSGIQLVGICESARCFFLKKLIDDDLLIIDINVGKKYENYGMPYKSFIEEHFINHFFKRIVCAWHWDGEMCRIQINRKDLINKIRRI